MNDKVNELVERTRLTPEELESTFQKSYAEALKWSEKYEVALSAKNWNPNRPADRERWFCTQHTEWIMRDIAKAQQDKILNDPDLALIDRGFLWKIKAMLRGMQIKQQNDPEISWETSLDVALKEFDDKVIPLAEALKEETDGTPIHTTPDSD